MNAWVVVLVAGAGSLAFRLGVVMIVDRHPVPAWLERIAGHVLPAAFAALALTALVPSLRAGGVPAIPPAVAAVVTVSVARSRPALHAFASGLCALWLASALISIA